jgi:hypothetical protein
MHSYPSGRNPTFNLDTKISQENLIASPPKPIWATETGYYNKPNDGGEVSELAAGKYMPRLFGEYFNRGITRTYSYELIDQNPTTDKESNFGLLRWDLSPKPAYTAMKNMIDLLKEPGQGNTATGSLNLTITGASTVHHTLLEKSDGTYYLLLWNDLSSWNVSTQQDVVNADTSVQVALGATFPEARLYQPNISSSAMSSMLNVSNLNLNVPDQMLIVALVPEPGTMAMMTAMPLLLLMRRRK